MCMRWITWLVSKGFKNNYVFGFPNLDLSIHYTTLRRSWRWTLSSRGSQWKNNCQKSATFGVFCIKIGACSWLQAIGRSKKRKIAETKGCAKLRMHTNKIPYPFWIILQVGRYVIFADLCEDQLSMFWEWGGSNFLFPHKLSSSPLHHSRTTVRVCDIASFLLKVTDFHLPTHTQCPIGPRDPVEISWRHLASKIKISKLLCDVARKILRLAISV